MTDSVTNKIILSADSTCDLDKETKRTLSCTLFSTPHHSGWKRL